MNQELNISHTTQVHKIITGSDEHTKLCEKCSMWVKMKDFVNEEVQARQEVNAEIALNLCLDLGIDWLLHIDSDELFYSEKVNSDCEGLRVKG